MDYLLLADKVFPDDIKILVFLHPCQAQTCGQPQSLTYHTLSYHIIPYINMKCLSQTTLGLCGVSCVLMLVLLARWASHHKVWPHFFVCANSLYQMLCSLFMLFQISARSSYCVSLILGFLPPFCSCRWDQSSIQNIGIYGPQKWFMCSTKNNPPTLDWCPGWEGRQLGLS